MLLQFMVLFELLLSMLSSVDFFMDGSRCSNRQVHCCAAVSGAFVDCHGNYCCADVDSDADCCSHGSAYIPVRLLMVTVTLAVLPILCSF